jgi:hypothetical protein
MSSRYSVLRSLAVALLVLGGLAACDTTVNEGDTTVIVLLGADGRPDSVLVDGVGFPIDLPPGDSDPPPGDSDVVFDINRMVGAWQLTEAEPAALGTTPVAVSSDLDLEISSFGAFGLGVAYIVRPLGPIAVIECASSFTMAPVTSFLWNIGNCGGLQGRTVDLTFSAEGDTLNFHSSDFDGLARLADLISIQNLGLPGGGVRLKFVRSARACFYC